MVNYQSLQHVFLIAMPQLEDPFFTQSVVYLWEYNEQGAAGIVINKPLDMDLRQLLEQLDISSQDPRLEKRPVLRGGPVLPGQGFIIRRRASQDANAEATLEITVSSAKQDLVELSYGYGLDDSLVALGCAEWTPGQLDKELANNDWLIAPFSEATLFEDPQVDSSRMAIVKWHTAAARAGIDLTRLSSDVGHA